MRTAIIVTLFVSSFMLYAFMPQAPTKPTQADVEKTLDALHDAASKAEFDRYFALYAPDAVFLGTDAAERWTLDQFKAFAKPLFDQGKGWTYTVRKGARHISFGPDATYAWFDELLDNAKYGECRGTGVLRKIGNDWKIAQYSLTFPIPNDIAGEVTKQIREFATGKLKSAQP